MSLDSAALLAEVISSIVIVVTLIYLVKQTRQTNKALLANSRQTTMITDVQFLLELMKHPEVKWTKNEYGAPEVSDERVSAARATVAYIRIREFAWFQYRSGILDDAAWRSIMAPTARVLGSEIGAESWALYRDELDAGFVAFCEELTDAGKELE